MPKVCIIDVNKLTSYLNDVYSNISFNELRNLDSESPVLKNICLKMFGRFDRTSKFYIKKFLQRNTGNIKYLLRERAETVLKEESYHEKLGRISQNNICLTDFSVHSYYAKCSVYSLICQHMNIKNSLKNRLEISLYWKRNSYRFMKKPKHVDQLFDESTSVLNKIDSGTCEKTMKRIESCKDIIKSSPSVSIEYESRQEGLIKPLSSEKYAIPVEVLQLGNIKGSMETLPRGSVNMCKSSLIMPPFTKCNFF